MSGLSTNPASLFRASTHDAVAGLHAAGHMEALQAEVLGLFDELRDRLLRYSMSFGISRQDSEDVLQECFMALFRHLQADRSRENLPGWAFRTTHNLSLKRRASVQAEHRTAVPEETAEVQVCDEGPGPEEHLLFSERQQRLRAVVRALPETDQMCLRLRAEGMRYREIAGTLGISLGSVAGSLARSFERLQRTDAR
jgi:RNA polymerase sigma-70 factor (ECF subfamily)